DHNGENDVGGVLSVADDGPKADDRQCADEAEGAGDVVADDLRYHGDQDGEQHEGRRKRSGNIDALASPAINPGHRGAQEQRREQSNQNVERCDIRPVHKRRFQKVRHRDGSACPFTRTIEPASFTYPRATAASRYFEIGWGLSANPSTNCLNTTGISRRYFNSIIMRFSVSNSP